MCVLNRRRMGARVTGAGVRARRLGEGWGGDWGCAQRRGQGWGQRKAQLVLGKVSAGVRAPLYAQKKKEAKSGWDGPMHWIASHVHALLAGWPVPSICTLAPARITLFLSRSLQVMGRNKDKLIYQLIIHALLSALCRDGFKSVEEAVGADHRKGGVYHR